MLTKEQLEEIRRVNKEYPDEIVGTLLSYIDWLQREQCSHHWKYHYLDGTIGLFRCGLCGKEKEKR